MGVERMMNILKTISFLLILTFCVVGGSVRSYGRSINSQNLAVKVQASEKFILKIIEKLKMELEQDNQAKEFLWMHGGRRRGFEVLKPKRMKALYDIVNKAYNILGLSQTRISRKARVKLLVVAYILTYPSTGYTTTVRSATAIRDAISELKDVSPKELAKLLKSEIKNILEKGVKRKVIIQRASEIDHSSVRGYSGIISNLLTDSKDLTFSISKAHVLLSAIVEINRELEFISTNSELTFLNAA